MGQIVTVDSLMPEFIDCFRGYIYLITNKVTGKQYVGQTSSSIRERWRGHAYGSQGEMAEGIGGDVKKYGPQCFKIEILQEVKDPSVLDALEIFYIQKYNTYETGYNRTPGGKSFCDSHKLNISMARVGLKLIDNPKPLKNRSKGKRLPTRTKKVKGTHVVTGEVITMDSLSSSDKFDPRLISAVCRGKRRHHRGYKWEYV